MYMKDNGCWKGGKDGTEGRIIVGREYKKSSIYNPRSAGYAG